MANEKEEVKKKRKPRIKPIIEAADSLSLGISMVVAVVMGVGIGYLLKTTTGIPWLFWIGVAIGIAAAILNVYKAYSKQYQSYQELAKEPRYAIKQQLDKKKNQKLSKKEQIQQDEDDEDSFWEDDYSETKY